MMLQYVSKRIFRLFSWNKFKKTMQNSHNGPLVGDRLSCRFSIYRAVALALCECPTPRARWPNLAATFASLDLLLLNMTTLLEFITRLVKMSLCCIPVAIGSWEIKRDFYLQSDRECQTAFKCAWRT